MERLYLVLDSQGRALCQGILESSPHADMLQVRLLGDEWEETALTGEVQLIGLDDSLPARRGEITRQRGCQIVVRPTAELGAEARENLRVRTNFKSVIYPVTGQWRGQRAIRCHDLSCGGIAFHTMQKLSPGEVAELVLPVTDEPLLLHLRVLRTRTTEEPVPLYAARFVDLILDQEIMIRKAVFAIQVKNFHQKS